MKLSVALISVLVATLLAGPLARGQDAKPGTEQPKPAEQPKAEQTENLPTAESLFEKHIAALGGMEALKAEKNRVVRAKYAGPGAVGTGMLRVMRVAPNKMYQTMEIPGRVTQEVWFNGEEGWIRDSNTGTHRVPSDGLADLKRQADYLGEANYKVRYKEIKTISAEKFNEVDAYAVRAVPAEGKERTLYFDAQSGLLIGIRTPGEEGVEPETVMSLQDYKKFGQVLQPTKSVTKFGSSESTITITEIQTDLSVMPTVEPPDEVRSVK